MNYEEYSHLAFLDKLKAELREDVLKFVHVGTLSPLLDKALQQSQDLRDHIDAMLDKELEKHGKG